MALPPLATVADLEAAMQRDSGSLNESQAELALRRASARVRAHTRQDITLVEGETIELPGGERVLTVPQRPLVVDESHPLTVVELGMPGGVEVTLTENTDYTRLGNELTRGYPWWSPTRTMGWPWQQQPGVWAPRVRVTYSHGWSDIPDDIMDIVLDLASMNLANPENLRSISIDDYARTFASETIGNARLTPGHKADLRPYRRPAFSVRPS
ncbi:hypothetical protein [Streptomyces pacificus]|uniref:Uncharacterized protein n=1 Tax=Streptomyces pacificus TaxID=2705029 RepID=A0A6A0AQY9_9ACTN|nr:hypothetical protein [Streptomyces pacificus]GFH34294.1 hypothetical protein SCWH03_05080 [Streptomyces pacificus]